MRVNKTYILFIVSFLFFSNFLLAHNEAEEWQTILKEINNFLQGENLFLTIEYSQIKQKGEDFEKIDECKFIKQKDLKVIIFSDYEIFTNQSIYIKADHKNQLLYIFKSTDNSKKGDDILGDLVLSDLSHYDLTYDSIKSQLKSGILSLKGKGNYRELILVFNPKDKSLERYTIYYNNNVSLNLYALEIRLTKIKNEEYKNQYLSHEKYIKFNKKNYKLNPIYEKYELIRNF